ncbi:MAG: glycosyltransferase family 4 protein, partial [Pseudomonadota bacterium]
ATSSGFPASGSSSTNGCPGKQLPDWRLFFVRIAYLAVKGFPLGGGIENLTEQIGVRLVERGHEVLVYSSSDHATHSGLYKGLRVKVLPAIKSRTFRKLSLVGLATADLLAKERVDIAHFHAVGPSVFSFLPRLAGVPTVVQVHGLEWMRDKWGLAGKAFFKLSDYSAVFFPNRTTVVSKVLKNYYETRFGREVVYIPTGAAKVDPRCPKRILDLGLKPREYILFAARLVEEKGAHYLIEAFRRLPTTLRLVVAGDAAHEETYKARLKRLAAADERILFPGFVHGELLAELFSNAYLFVLPSTIEGLPIALLEAMAYGNCCLASDIPENLEALGGHGCTFRNRDVSDLAAVLQRLITDGALVESKRDLARRHVLAEYSWDRVADEIEALYHSVLKRRIPGL